MDEKVRNWLIKANNDYKVAEYLLGNKEKESMTDAICFHLQQCAEKLFKGYLLYKGIEFSKTHNLEFLIRKCSLTDTDFESLDPGILTSYATSLRYPEDFRTPSFEEAQRAFETASGIRKFVLMKLQTDGYESTLFG